MKSCDDWEKHSGVRLRKRLKCAFRPGERCVPLRNDTDCKSCIEEDIKKESKKNESLLLWAAGRF